MCALVISGANGIFPAPHFIVIFGLAGCTILFHLTSYKAQFSEKVSNIKSIFRFSLQLLSETFLIIWKKLSGYYYKCIYIYIYIYIYIGLHVNYPLFLLEFNGIWIFSTFFRNFKYQIPLNSVKCISVIPCRRTKGHIEGNSRFSKFLWTLLKILYAILALFYIDHTSRSVESVLILLTIESL